MKICAPAAPGCSWLFLAASGWSWLLLGAPGCVPGCLLDAAGCSWVPLGAPECLLGSPGGAFKNSILRLLNLLPQLIPNSEVLSDFNEGSSRVLKNHLMF